MVALIIRVEKVVPEETIASLYPSLMLPGDVKTPEIITDKRENILRDL